MSLRLSLLFPVLVACARSIPDAEPGPLAVEVAAAPGPPEDPLPPAAVGVAFTHAEATVVDNGPVQLAAQPASDAGIRSKLAAQPASDAGIRSPVPPADAAGPPEEVAAEDPVDTLRSYTLDPHRSRLYVLVRYERGTPLAAMAHDHTIAATGWSGSVQWDAAAPMRCVVDVDVPVSGLAVDPPGLRARAGLEGETPPEDEAKITENMWGRHQLDAAVFSSMTFHSTGCVEAADGAIVSGNLTIHGVTRPISIPMAIEAGPDRFTARGEITLATSSFGFEPFTAALGAIKNQDPLRLTIDVVGTP